MKLDQNMLLTLKFEAWKTGAYQSEQDILFTLRDYVYTTYNAHLDGCKGGWELNFNDPKDETFFRLKHS